jgi:hypothetical protein
MLYLDITLYIHIMLYFDITLYGHIILYITLHWFFTAVSILIRGRVTVGRTHFSNASFETFFISSFTLALILIFQDNPFTQFTQLKFRINQNKKRNLLSQLTLRLILHNTIEL